MIYLQVLFTSLNSRFNWLRDFSFIRAALPSNMESLSNALRLSMLFDKNFMRSGDISSMVSQVIPQFAQIHPKRSQKAPHCSLSRMLLLSVSGLPLSASAIPKKG